MLEGESIRGTEISRCEVCGEFITHGSKCCRNCYQKVPRIYKRSNDICNEINSMIQPYLKSELVSPLYISKEISERMITTSHKPTIARFVRILLKDYGYINDPNCTAKRNRLMIFAGLDGENNERKKTV